MPVRCFKDLNAWQKSMDLAVMVYEKVKFLPKEEMFSLSSQMRRAAISIPSNIAEGQQRKSLRVFLRFLLIANGSLGELETQLILCERLNYLKSEEMGLLMVQCSETGKLLNGLMNSVQQQIQKQTDKRTLPESGSDN